MKSNLTNLTNLTNQDLTSLILREGSQIKKLRKFGHMSKLQVGRVFLSHTFSKKKVWAKLLRVDRLDIDVHTYKSIQNPNNGQGRDLFLVVWKGFLYIPIKILHRCG